MQSRVYHFVANFFLFQKHAIFNDFVCTRRYSRCKWRRCLKG